MTAMDKFFTIEAIPNRGDRFVIIGILSKQEDVEPFIAAAEASGKYEEGSVSTPEELDMGEILDGLVNDRLRELATPISQLAALLTRKTKTDNAPDDFPKPTHQEGREPCGECHLPEGERCDICGAKDRAS
jgi:hypothetical protein